MEPEVKSRTYDAAGRQARSAQTRQRIVVAREPIVAQGYRATTIAAIAARAGVNVDTIYELVGRKPELIRELIEKALSGTEHAVVAEERDYVKAMRSVSDPGEKLAISAAAVCPIQAHMAPIYLALRDAASTEPEARECLAGDQRAGAANMRKLVHDLRDAGELRPGLTTDQAADVLWATNSSELFVLLTVERSWSVDRFELWLADTWRRILLG